MLFLRDKFDLESDKAREEEVVENVEKSVEFKGTNLWILIFATFIASIGLNVNSTAVIIGAMLVSPLMGPIMGFGLSLGINDFDLLKRSLRNFLFAVGTAFVVSTVYFLFSPVSGTQSELLARTSPTIWDVLIALFGGLAGIVAQSRKDRTSTVIPGVAIATALMPPLCTAGYGMATMQLNFLFGALYLFFINAVFISLATFLLVRFMNYRKKQFVNPRMERKVRHYMLLAVIITVVPSIIFAYKIVQQSFFENNAKNFIEGSFRFSDTQVVDYKTFYTKDNRRIEVLLMGTPISADAITTLQDQLPNYKRSDPRVVIRQQGQDTLNTSTAIASIDKLYAMSNTIIKEKDNKIKELENKVALIQDTLPVQEITREFSAISSWKEVEIAMSKMVLYSNKAPTQDTILVCLIKSRNEKTNMSSEEQQKIIEWLKVRTSTENIRLITEP